MPDLSHLPAGNPLLMAIHIAGIVIAALIVLRLIRLFVHGIVAALMSREATEGTARDLTAIEVTKRIETISSLANSVLRFFVVAIVALWILEKSGGVDIGLAVADAKIGQFQRRLEVSELPVIDRVHRDRRDDAFAPQAAD